MPQDIPLEAGEDQFFTPPSLEHLDPKPVFVLRAATPRDKRFQSRLYTENGFTFHHEAAVRAEIMRALKSGKLWTTEQAEQYCPMIQDLWDARDAHEALVKEEPDAVFGFDADLEEQIDLVIDRTIQAWPALRRMEADNREMSQVMVPVSLAAVVKSWSGFDAPRALDRGYLTLDCAELLVERLRALSPLATSELFVAAVARMRLDKDEEKNSASPSRSGTAPKRSKETKVSGSDGSSPESMAADKADDSIETPETA